MHPKVEKSLEGPFAFLLPFAGQLQLLPVFPSSKWVVTGIYTKSLKVKR